MANAFGQESNAGGRILAGADFAIVPGDFLVHEFDAKAAKALGVATLRAVDERGVLLPIDPSRTAVDAPVVNAAPRDAAVYHLLGAMQREAPSLYSRISSIRSTGGGEML